VSAPETRLDGSDRTVGPVLFDRLVVNCPNEGNGPSGWLSREVLAKGTCLLNLSTRNGSVMVRAFCHTCQQYVFSDNEELACPVCFVPLGAEPQLLQS